MQLSRLITPATLLVVTALVVGIPAERSHSFNGTVNIVAFFATTVAIYAIFTLALNVQWGYTGIFNFGIAAFFLVGAYTAAIVAMPPSDSDFVRYVGGFGDALSLPFLNSGEWLPFLVATGAAGAASGLLALLLAIPTLRLREDYLAIATIGVAELLRRIVIEQDNLVNGTRSLPGIPGPLEGYFDPDAYRFVKLAIAVGVLILVFIAVERGIRSPWGRVLRALKEDELATAASGKNVSGFKMQGFVLGAIFMGVGGAVFAFTRGSLGPTNFLHFPATFIFWAMLLVGGSGNNRGAVAGAYVVWGVWFIMLQLSGYNLPDILQSRLFFLRDFLIGALILTVLLLRPQGLFPEERRVSIWLDRRMRGLRQQERAPPEHVEETGS